MGRIIEYSLHMCNRCSVETGHYPLYIGQKDPELVIAFPVIIRPYTTFEMSANSVSASSDWFEITSSSCVRSCTVSDVVLSERSMAVSV